MDQYRSLIGGHDKQSPTGTITTFLVALIAWAAKLRPLLPSFIADLLRPDLKPKYKIHPTSYLDGLRGLAAFCVCLFHYTQENAPYLMRAWGVHKKNDFSTFVQLPLIRLIYSGGPMVPIFFVISGFVLSYKPLKSIHARDLDKCYTALVSSTFRRPFRLFLPCLISTLCIAVLVHMGWLYKAKPTVLAEVRKWVADIFLHVTWSWDWERQKQGQYDGHLWTIPVEFAHSMLLFMTILCLSRVRLRVRQVATALIVVYSWACGKWAAAEFIGGMFLAEIHILQSASRGDPSSKLRSRLKTAFQILLLIASAFVGSWPIGDAQEVAFYKHLIALTPSVYPEPRKFWYSITALCTVWCSGDLFPIKRFLEGSFAQYAGRISYAIYIVHGPVLHLLQRHINGRAAVPAKGTPGLKGYKKAIVGYGIKGLFGTSNQAQRILSWLSGVLMLGFVVVWVADIFWRWVDIPVVNLTRKIEMACLDTEAEYGPLSLETKPETDEGQGSRRVE